MKNKRNKKSKKNTTKDWFSSWSNEYDDTLGKIGFHTELLSTIAKNAHLKSKDKVLDIGCGTGLLSLKLLQKAACHITGIDNSEGMMAIFQEKIKRLNLQANVTCQFMDALDLKFKKDTFDKVVSSVTLHHLKDKKKAIRAAHRILKPGGIFILGEIDMDSTGSHSDANRLKRILNVLEQEWIFALKNVGIKAFVRMYDNGKKHIFNEGEYCISLKQWAKICRDAGFKQVRVKRLPHYKCFGIITAKKMRNRGKYPDPSIIY
ncbi:MAG: methyltransferase domain-containing protein [Candidatus Omnitrophota bacterium]